MKITKIIFIILIPFVILFMALSTREDPEEKRMRGSEKFISEYGEVFTAEDGTLISIYPYHGEEAFRKNLDTVIKFQEKCPLDVFVAIPPRKMDALVSLLPKDFDVEPAEHLFGIAKENTENFIDLLEPLRDEKGFYFKTDHHWTSDGAYLAYREIAKALGVVPLDKDCFEIELFTDKYRGSDHGKKNVSYFDSIYLYYPPRYSSFEITLVSHPYDSEENNVLFPEMYLKDRRDSWDPYTVYFGGNNPYITMRDGSDRDTLLIIRDSFASALAPFLAEHFDIVMIDPRFYPERLRKAIEHESVDSVLIIENMGSFTENEIKFIY